MEAGWRGSIDQSIKAFVLLEHSTSTRDFIPLKHGTSAAAAGSLNQPPSIHPSIAAPPTAHLVLWLLFLLWLLSKRQHGLSFDSVCMGSTQPLLSQVAGTNRLELSLSLSLIVSLTTDVGVDVVSLVWVDVS